MYVRLYTGPRASSDHLTVFGYIRNLFFAFISRVVSQHYRKPRLNLIFHDAQRYLTETPVSYCGCLMLFKVSRTWYVFSDSECTLKCLLVILRRHVWHCFSFHPCSRTTHSTIYHCCSTVSYVTSHWCYQLYYRSFVRLPNSIYDHYQVLPFFLPLLLLTVPCQLDSNFYYEKLTSVWWEIIYEIHDTKATKFTDMFLVYLLYNIFN